SNPICPKTVCSLSPYLIMFHMKFDQDRPTGSRDILTIFTLNSIIRNNRQTFASFIDLKKAFDFVDRDLLLYKLLLTRIDGKVYHTIKNIYCHTTACVRINGKLTNWFDCKSGVRQGCNLSPTLFSIFINDLVAEINSLNVGVKFENEQLSMLLYADDIVFVSSSEAEMQLMLNTLHQWCKKWRVLINTTKSKAVHFRQHRQPRSLYQFRIGDNLIDTVETYKYLGVIFHEKLDFSHTAKALAAAAGRALGGIISKVHNMKDFGFSTYEKLFESCVIPVLDYGTSVWGFKTYNEIDSVQNRAIRYFLGVHRFSPNLAINGDVGWLPSTMRHWHNMVRMLNRITVMDDSRLTKRIFDIDHAQGQYNNNWSSELRRIFNSIDMIDTYDTKQTVDMCTVKQKLYSYYADSWPDKVRTSPKLRTYITFKTSYETENYVKMNLQRNERSILAQFRCGVLPLRIETGRFVGEKPEERLCRLCNCNTPEDETHFLLDCTLYTSIRDQWFKDIIQRISDNSWIQMNNSDKIKFLVCTYPRQTAKYLVSAFLKRRKTLYKS
ncbi:MAG: reverse transcriptase family protein, partial [Candidatus Thiodiazotropha endolucinida]|nr:reverse transcriptase family protein [Candidatus Thiodiazotropha taylori]MCW4347294.1 reverse transcriptase family protein [Candidatus Thiodiazotropha endolucinida]